MKPLPLIRYLSDSEVALIHDRSLTLCAEMGMKITYAALLGRLAKAGAIVADEVVRFPREMVEAAIEAAPKELALHGRCGQVQMAGRGHRDKFPTLHANAVRMLDHGAGQLRDSTFEDLTSLLKLADSLGTVARVATPVYPWDVPEPLRELRCVEAMLTHTTKNLIEAPQTVFELDLWCEALELFAYAPLPEKALVAITISPKSPLAISDESAEILIQCAGRRLPVLCAPCPMAGGTSPYTIAGTVLQQNAESLAMVTMVQLLAEGCPIIYGGAAGPLDMRSGALSYGAQERNLSLGATMDLAEHYGFPNYSPAGSVDSPGPDVQIGLEKMATMLTRVLSPAQMTPSLGAVYNGLAMSLEQLLIDCEICEMCLRIASGVEVSDETLALDAILRVGHAGQFLMDEHTLDWARDEEENYVPRLSTRAGDAGKPMLESAHEEAQRLIAEYEPSVPSQQIDKVRQWAADKERELAP